jgi:hypothetical protein
MWRMAILSIGLLSLVLASCDSALFAGRDRPGNGDYEVMALIAE